MSPSESTLLLFVAPAAVAVAAAFVFWFTGRQDRKHTTGR